MDLDRAKDMIKAIPYMSKTIVDDTLFEKVLSFLVMVLTSDPNAVEAFEQIGIYNHIRKVRSYT